MPQPARGSKLDPYAEEILRLHREGRKLGEIGRYLAATYGLSVAISTLSEFVNRDRPAELPSLPPAPPAADPPAPTVPQQMLLDQVEVYAEIQASLRVLVEEVQAMRTQPSAVSDLRAHLEEIARQLAALRSQAPAATPQSLPPELRSLLQRLLAFLTNQERGHRVAGYPVPYTLIRRIWARAFWTVSAGWLFFFAVWTHWLGYWHWPQLLVQWIAGWFTYLPWPKG